MQYVYIVMGRFDAMDVTEPVGILRAFATMEGARKYVDSLYGASACIFKMSVAA